MSTIEFDGDEYSKRFQTTRSASSTSTGGLTKQVIKLGIAKDERSAQKLFLWTASIGILLSIYIFSVYVFGFHLSGPKNIDYTSLTPIQRSALPLGLQQKIKAQQQN